MLLIHIILSVDASCLTTYVSRLAGASSTRKTMKSWSCKMPGAPPISFQIIDMILYSLAAAWHIFRESLFGKLRTCRKRRWPSLRTTPKSSKVIEEKQCLNQLESFELIMETWFSTCPTCFSYFGGHRIEIRSGQPEGSSRGIVAWRSDSCLQWSGRRIACNMQKALISLFLMDYFVGIL